MLKRLSIVVLLIAAVVASNWPPPSAHAQVTTSQVPVSFSANGACAPINPASGQSSATLSLNGTYVMSITLQGVTTDGRSETISTDTNATSVSTNGIYHYALKTYAIVRACVTSYTSGTATGYLRVSAANGYISTAGGSSIVTCASPGCVIASMPPAVISSLPPVTVASAPPITGSVALSGVCYICLTPQAPFVLTSSSAQTCTQLGTTPLLLTSVTNGTITPQTATLTLFNDAGCATALHAYVLGNGQTVTFGQGDYFSVGLYYTLSGAAINNVSLWYSK